MVFVGVVVLFLYVAFSRTHFMISCTWYPAEEGVKEEIVKKKSVNWRSRLKVWRKKKTVWWVKLKMMMAAATTTAVARRQLQNVRKKSRQHLIFFSHSNLIIWVFIFCALTSINLNANAYSYAYLCIKYNWWYCCLSIGSVDLITWWDESSLRWAIR